MKIIKQSKSYSWIIIKLNEGKNQHIRKIFKRIGFNVNKLIRIQYGPYKIGSLETGKIRVLNSNKLSVKVNKFMIITTGTLKFKKIKALKNSTSRPTSNKVRQAIFNILRYKLKMDEWKQTAFMLDAFAGTGVVSFEALSRGVYESTLIEKDFTNFKNLKDNADFESFSKSKKIINKDFLILSHYPINTNLFI